LWSWEFRFFWWEAIDLPFTFIELTPASRAAESPAALPREGFRISICVASLRNRRRSRSALCGAAMTAISPSVTKRADGFADN
jgi:hypothetical protein